MPFKSKAQRAYLYANHPEMAKQWEADTPKDAALPERAAKPKAKRATKSKPKKLPDGGHHQ